MISVVLYRPDVQIITPRRGGCQEEMFSYVGIFVDRNPYVK